MKHTTLSGKLQPFNMQKRGNITTSHYQIHNLVSSGDKHKVINMGFYCKYVNKTVKVSDIDTFFVTYRISDVTFRKY